MTDVLCSLPGESSPSREGSPQNSFAPTKFEQLMGSLKVAKPLKEGEAADPTQVAKQVRTPADGRALSTRPASLCGSSPRMVLL